MAWSICFLSTVWGCSQPRDEPAADANVGGNDGGIDITDPPWPDDAPLPPELDFPPYVNLLDATTVVVSWRTVGATTGRVRFGRTSLDDEIEAAAPGNLHHVALTGLAAGAAYRYEVAIDGTSVRRHGTFVMPGREQWRFIFIGEFHAPSDAADAARFASVIREFRPHVIVESGDMLDDGTRFEQFRSYLRASAPWISNAIFLPAHSNHVNGDGGNPTMLDLYVLPNNERWYATRYGQAQLLTLDSTTAANDDVATEEIPWLAEQTRLAHDGIDDPTFVIAAWHHPACSSQYFTRWGERNWVQSNLVSTLQANGGVDLVLVGHDKYYERSTIAGGIVHVMTNLGKVSPEIPGGNHPDCTPIKTSRSGQSLGLATVDGRSLAVRIVDETGTGVDAFTIAK